MKNLTHSQLKILSEFASTIAAAWFTAGIISPFFIKPQSLVELITFPTIGLLMTWVTLSWALTLIKDIKL